MPNQIALALPDALLVRYFRAGEIDQVKTVEKLDEGRVRVELTVDRKRRVDLWRDLGGGLGFVPDQD